MTSNPSSGGKCRHHHDRPATWRAPIRADRDLRVAACRRNGHVLRGPKCANSTASLSAGHGAVLLGRAARARSGCRGRCRLTRKNATYPKEQRKKAEDSQRGDHESSRRSDGQAATQARKARAQPPEVGASALALNGPASDRQRTFAGAGAIKIGRRRPATRANPRGTSMAAESSRPDEASGRVIDDERDCGSSGASQPRRASPCAARG